MLPRVTGSETVRLLLSRPNWLRIQADGRILYVLAPRLSDSAAADVTVRSGDAQSTLSALEEHGECAVIEIVEAQLPTVILATDVNRSFPLYWTRHGGQIRVSDDSRLLAADDPNPDPSSLNQFRHAGFVLGTGTLYQRVRTGAADTVVTLDRERATERRRSRFALPVSSGVQDPAEAAHAFRDAVLTSVGDLVARNPSRQFVVPLSGGVDSRVIVSALRLAGAQHVHTFTYGRPDSSEARSSQRVAEALDLPWTFIQLQPHAIRNRWRSPENAPFIAGTFGGDALPHIQDWYAMGVLAAKKVLAPGAVILPGHTAVRTLKDDDLLTTPELARGDLVDAIVSRHYGQAGTADPVRHDRAILELIGGIVDDYGFDGTPPSTARSLQAVNILGRQSKYILNSVRAYEVYGLGWAMPLLDARAHRAVAMLDWTLTRDRSWYTAMADAMFREVAGDRADGLDFWQPLPVSDSARTTVRAALERVHLRQAVEQALSTRTNLRHPMGFEAFAPNRARYLRDLVRGHSPFGIFAEAFLDGTWNPSFDWRSPSTWSTPAPRFDRLC